MNGLVEMHERMAREFALLPRCGRFAADLPPPKAEAIAPAAVGANRRGHLALLGPPQKGRQGRRPFQSKNVAALGKPNMCR